MSSTPSLTLRSLLIKILGSTGLGRHVARVTGPSAPVRALSIAAAAHGLSKGVVLFVVPTDADIEPAVNDVRFFLSGLESLAEASVEQQVLPFPSPQVDPYRGFLPHLKVASARARALHALAAGTARVVVSSAQALLPRVPDPVAVFLASCELKPGIEVDPQSVTKVLAAGGYEPQDPVDAHGEFFRRGGILDIFPPSEAMPIRIEFVGDTVESIRRFDPGTQRSVETLDQFVIVPAREDGLTDSETGSPLPADGMLPSTIFDYIRARDARFFVAEPEDVRKHIETSWVQLEASYLEREGRPGPAPRPPVELSISWPDVESATTEATMLEQLGVDRVDFPETLQVPCQPATLFHGRVQDWVADVRQALTRNETVVVVAGTHGRAERTVELLRDYEVRALPATEAGDVVAGAVIVAEGWLSSGFRLPSAGFQIYAESDVFEEERRRTTGAQKRSLSATFLSDLRDLKVNDLIVHVDHGIGRFVGLRQISVAQGDIVQEFIELRYHDDAKLFVPVERLDLIQKYTGGANPPLDRLGGTSWEKAKTKVKKAMRDMAEELLKLYAARRAVPGHPFSADTHWQEEFEGAFEFELTPDQTTAIADIKRDMESATPMDRLLCGDVGYGKTEVAMRAAFKAVMEGKQIAVLAPTTVLASQHLKTFTDRFAAFPVRIDMVSRFRTKAEIAQTLEALVAGRLDIIVGTHRLLSNDVKFRDLGLLVVDEEQRFGVAHKERIKQLRKTVDVLTMTATPIPRTLNMSLVGIRDMSVIETPPKDRLAIQTNVVKFDSGVIARAIRNEIARGGQIFFVHNRVESIYSMGHLLQRLVPEARVVVGHGQMGEDALERAMLDFMAHKFDVLLATTIVENGLDIPNANTIVINRADRYGLSQLYQLRGRVGRSDRAAYAYLLIPPEEALSAVARKRLSAIREFSELGSGFRVAALDLEIRGAGNLLGGEQSGQIDAVGFEMYMKLLEETIRELKGEDLEDDVRATVNLKVDVRLDEAYVSDTNQRLMIYRRVAGARSEDEIVRIVEEIRDRYGPPPAALLNLADFGRIRVLADGLGVETLDRDSRSVVFKFRDKAKVDPLQVIELVKRRGDLQLIPPSTLKLDLEGPLEPLGKTVSTRGGRHRRQDRRPAWWTARATAGEVKPGFTKAEILKDAPEDPRAPNGVLARVTELLEELRG
jgi:transcription-repair coupling factor (superfamily II helicase)